MTLTDKGAAGGRCLRMVLRMDGKAIQGTRLEFPSKGA